MSIESRRNALDKSEFSRFELVRSTFQKSALWRLVSFRFEKEEQEKSGTQDGIQDTCQATQRRPDLTRYMQKA